MAKNRVIGRANRLPWRLGPDLRRFKQTTLGHTLVMGRKTFESVGRPLPGRRTIVVTSRTGWHPPGVEVAHTIPEALELARSESEVFIAGGEEIYRQTLDRADRLYLTVIEGDYEGDTRFPEIDLSRWRLVEEERFAAPTGFPFGFSFRVYDREPPRGS